jgi:hypothetical protein
MNRHRRAASDPGVLQFDVAAPNNPGWRGGYDCSTFMLFLTPLCPGVEQWICAEQNGSINFFNQDFSSSDSTECHSLLCFGSHTHGASDRIICFDRSRHSGR